MLSPPHNNWASAEPVVGGQQIGEGRWGSADFPRWVGVGAAVRLGAGDGVDVWPGTGLAAELGLGEEVEPAVGLELASPVGLDPGMAV